MDPSQQKQEFSIAYVHAVATVAGFAFDWKRVDQDSVDGQIAARTGAAGTTRRPRLEIQLKCTDLDRGRGDAFSYPLSVKNYNDLRDPAPFVPHVLVVVSVPRQVASWLSEPPDEMVLRRCAWWLDLRGSPPRPGSKDSVRVSVPRTRRLDVNALRDIMHRIDEGTF